MSWANRRRFIYASIVGLFLLLVVGLPSFLYFYEKPTCFDEKQNQEELGIDCGGSCELICKSDTVDLKILWSRHFYVTDGVYNVVAYVENSNFDAIARNVPYTFKVFDKENILIYERKGSTFISAKGIVPVFEAGLITGERIPARTVFEFRREPVWERTGYEANFVVQGITLSKEDTKPRIDAVLVNNGVDDYTDVPVVVTVFDIEGNAIASSRTVIKFIEGRSSVPLVFTWPNPYDRDVSEIDIIPSVKR